MSLSSRFFGQIKLAGDWEPLRVPIVCAPMASASGGALAAAVTRGGGLGFCGAGYWSAERLQHELQLFSTGLGLPHTTPSSHQRRPLGVGVLAWKLASLAGGKNPSPSDPPSTSPGHALVHLLASERVATAWFAFGSHAELSAWIAYLRHWDDYFRQGAESIRIVIGVGNLEQAKLALEFNPHALSLTGHEGGGHGLAAAPPIKSLLAQVRNELTSSSGRCEPLLFTAGGLADGFEAQSLLSAGADAAVFGTRFLLSPESLYSNGQKDLLLRAGTSSPGIQGNHPSQPTVRSEAFDEARGTIGWPPGVDGRGLFSQTVADFAVKGDAHTAYSATDLSRVVTWAGTGVERMHNLEPGETLTYRLAGEIGSSQSI